MELHLLKSLIYVFFFFASPAYLVLVLFICGQFFISSPSCIVADIVHLYYILKKRDGNLVKLYANPCSKIKFFCMCNLWASDGELLFSSSCTLLMTTMTLCKGMKILQVKLLVTFQMI